MNYKTLSFFLPILLFISSLAHSQDEFGAAKNNTYVEFGTNVIISSLSLNYERHFYSSASEKFHIYGRAGLGGSVMLYVWGPGGWGGLGGLTMLTGKNEYHFELSGGAFLGLDPYEKFSGEKGINSFVFPLLDIGYRYQRPDQGFLFRVKAGLLGVGFGLGYVF